MPCLHPACILVQSSPCPCLQAGQVTIVPQSKTIQGFLEVHVHSFGASKLIYSGDKVCLDSCMWRPAVCTPLAPGQIYPCNSLGCHVSHESACRLQVALKPRRPGRRPYPSPPLIYSPPLHSTPLCFSTLHYAALLCRCASSLRPLAPPLRPSATGA